MARALCGCRMANGRRRERPRAGKLFSPSGVRGRGKGTLKRDRGSRGRRKGPIGGQGLRVRGSIWKATLCRALYCTPCCFNQWQACSQSLEQHCLFFIVSLPPLFFLLRYTLTFLTKPPKSCAALSSPCRSQEKHRATAIKSISSKLKASVY